MQTATFVDRHGLRHEFRIAPANSYVRDRYTIEHRTYEVKVKPGYGRHSGRQFEQRLEPILHNVELYRARHVFRLLLKQLSKRMTNLNGGQR